MANQKNYIRRSILFMPASNERALNKSKSLNADGFAYDLEDAVAPDEKNAARKLVCDFVRQEKFERSEIIIRINDLDSEWGHDDVKAVCAAGPDAILIPKVGSASTILKIERLINQYAAPKKMKIWAMIETPLGVLNAYDIASSSERLTCLVVGTSDLVKDLHAYHSDDRLSVVHSLSHTLLAARATGKDALDGVHLNIKDETSFLKACEQGKTLGFDGKCLLHPSQIEGANKVFGPSASEIDQAKTIIEAYEDAIKKGQGVALLDGKLIENLHVENATRILNMAGLVRK